MKRHFSTLAVVSVTVALGLAGCTSQAAISSSPTASSVTVGSVSMSSAGVSGTGSTVVPEISSAAPTATASGNHTVVTSSPIPVATSAPIISSAYSTTTAASASSTAAGKSSAASGKSSTAAPVNTTASKISGAAALNSAQRKFRDLAKAAFPDVPAATVVQTAKTLCAQLGSGASVHDEVGQLAGLVPGQGAAEGLVRAAVSAYCPTVTLH